MPNDFVVVCSERKPIVRFVKQENGYWNKMIRSGFDWEFFDNVGESTAEEEYRYEFNEVFIPAKQAAE